MLCLSLESLFILTVLVRYSSKLGCFVDCLMCSSATDGNAAAVIADEVAAVIAGEVAAVIAAVIPDVVVSVVIVDGLAAVEAVIDVGVE